MLPDGAHGSPKANFAHRGKCVYIDVYVVLLGSLERVEHDCPRNAAASSYLQNVHLQLAAFGWLAFAAYSDASEVS